MVTIKDIEVHIVSSSDGRELVEFDDPNDITSQDSYVSKKFIEAITDLTYHIEVHLKPGFKLYGASGIKIGLTIDGGVVSQSVYYGRLSVEQNQRSGSAFVNSTVLFRERAIWRRSTYSFGSLKIGKSGERLASHRSHNMS